MKNTVINLRTVVCTILLMTAIGAQAQWKHLPKDKAMPPHPRILMMAGEEQRIKDNIAADNTWAKVHQAIINESDRMITLPELQRIMTGKRLLSVSREALRRIFYLSYSYRMTGKEAYAQKADREMLAISKFSDWNPSHFLDVAEMTMALSIGYDWLYNYLSAGSKDVITSAIFNRGLDPSMNSEYAWYITATHNWNQVCNAGITFGALALYEFMPQMTTGIIDRAVESIRLPMKDYDPDGAYPEGYGYWEYGTSFNVLFLSAIEKIYGADFGLSQNSAFLKTAGYQENMTGTMFQSFNYSDNALRGSLSTTMFWIASRVKDHSLLWNEKHYLSKDIGTNDRILPAIMIWGSDIKISEVQPPKNLLWTGRGITPVALMRTSWTNPNAIYVGFKGGTASSNHAHMDAGAFVMDADGIRWASDFGMQDYNSLESKGVDLWNRSQNSDRWTVFRYNNMAHNTLTIDNSLQVVEGFADMETSSDSPDFMNVIVNLSNVYKGQLAEAKRGIAIVNKQYVAVRDELKTLNREKTAIRWTMLTTADVKISGRNTFELRKEGKRMKVEISAPAGITLKTWSTKSPNDFDAENPGTTLLGFETTAPASTNVAFTVKLIPQSAKNTSGIIQELAQWPSR